MSFAGVSSEWSFRGYAVTPVVVINVLSSILEYRPQEVPVNVNPLHSTFDTQFDIQLLSVLLVLTVYGTTVTGGALLSFL